ncbi:MAG: hypothetical protein ACI8X5_000514 [Planctomycetota bacterium]
MLLVGNGSYAGFVIDKPLSVFAMPSASVIVHGTLSVVGIDLGERVIVSGIDVEIATSFNPKRALYLYTNRGYVYFQDCEFKAAQESVLTLNCYYYSGEDGARIHDSDQVAFSNCSLFGGAGLYTDECCGWGLGQGGHGIYSVNSTITLNKCLVRGGQEDNDQQDWRYGIYLRGSTAYASGSDIASEPGYPHSGIFVESPSGFDYRDCLFSGPAGVSGAGTINQLSGAARSALTDTVASWASPGDLVFAGSTGDGLWALTSLAPKFRWLLPIGVQLLDVAFPLPTQSGVLPASGNLMVPLDFSAIAAPLSPAPVAIQGLAVGQGSRWLSGVRHLLPLDPVTGPDCNNNGINDYLEIIAGTRADIDENLVPDECP